MTATLPQRNGPPRGRPVSLVREYRLYRFYDDGGRLLYVGMTGRQTLERLLEHVRTKPWAAEVACWERDPRTWDNEADCLAAEKAAIVGERPLKNIAHNGNNPGPVAVRLSRPRPTNPAPSAWSRFWRSTSGRWLRARLVRAGRLGVVLAGLWAILFAVLALGSRYLDASMPVGDAAGGAVVVAVGMVVWWLSRRRKPARRNRRRAR